jgi:hypothetical protein
MFRLFSEIAKLNRYGNDVEEDGEEMEGAARKDEEMPYGVMVRQAAPAIEYEAQDIGEASGDEEPQAIGCEGGDQRLDGDDDEKAHSHIDAYRGDRPAAKQGYLKDDTEEGDCPDDGEKRPAPGTVDVHQQERGVRSGDQQKNGRMVEDPQDRLCLGDLDAVVEGRGRVKQDKRSPENTAAYNVPRVSEQRRKGGQYPERPDGEDGADPMGDAVGQLLPGSVLRHG